MLTFEKQTTYLWGLGRSRTRTALSDMVLVPLPTPESVTGLHAGNLKWSRSQWKLDADFGEPYAGSYQRAGG